MRLLNTLKNPPADSCDLTSHHFRLSILLNCLLFLFYLVFRLYMSLQLVFVEHQGLLDEFNYGEGPQTYTLLRVFLPVFLVAGFALLCYGLFRRIAVQSIRLFFHELFVLQPIAVARYLLFLILAIVILSFVPGLTLLLRNLDTQYGYIDADAYISMVKSMYRGDYNPSWMGGIAFGKYYPVTMPTLILTFGIGVGSVVAAYNIVLTIVVYSMILNVVFTFRNLFFDKSDGMHEEVTATLFIAAVIIIFLRFCIFRDFFNNDAVLQTFLHGFYGGLGASYLYTCIMFIFSHLLREGTLDFKQTISFVLIAALFSGMLVQAYFNLTLFLLPTSGAILAVLLSRKTSRNNYVKVTLLFLAYLILNYASYLALDIFNRYSMEPVRKLNIMSLGLVLFFVILLLVNRRFNDIILKAFLKYRSLFVLVLFLLPFAWYCYRFPDRSRIELLHCPIKLGTSRVYLLVLLLYALGFGYLLLKLLKLTLLRKRRYPVYGLILLVFLACLVTSNVYDMGKSYPFAYPAFYPSGIRIMDRSNPYAFDKNGIRVTYNEHLVGVIKYFARSGVTDAYYWIVSKTPSRGVYEHGLVQSVLAVRGHELEGITVKHFAYNELDRIPEWARIRLSNVIVRHYDDFVKHIFDIAREARVKDARFKRRYLILDNNFPVDTLKQLDASPAFHKMYENALYKVYRMEQPK